MDERHKTEIRRRDVLRAAATVGVAGAVSAASFRPSAADTDNSRGKRKSLYQANSPEVQAFYRVNRYPTT
jgi:nitrous oxide reductase